MELREQVFALTYCMPGMTFGDIHGMNSSDREWYIERLHKQKKDEAEEIKRASKGK